MLEKHAFRFWTAQEVFVAFLPALTVFAIIAFQPKVGPDGDSYWHIAAGNWMIEHGEVLRSDPFSYTFAGAPWNAHEWLSEVVFAAVNQAVGWHGLYLLMALFGAATAFLLVRTLLRYLDPVPAFIALQLALVNVVLVAQVRPQFLILPILVLWISELLAARSEQRAPGWILIPLMVLWVNLHGSFMLGLALIAPFALEALIAARGKRL